MEIKKIDLDQEQVQPSSQRVSVVERKVVEKPEMNKTQTIVTLGLFLAVILAGVLTGSFVKSKTSSGSTLIGGVAKEDIKAEIPQAGAKVGDTYGSSDEKTFKDKVLGVVDKGGTNGEGTHKLLRPGGKTQTVCLSSTTIDLDQLVGHQVTLWGETFNGQKCGWLMDVGRAKVENLNVPLPN